MPFHGLAFLPRAVNFIRQLALRPSNGQDIALIVALAPDDEHRMCGPLDQINDWSANKFFTKLRADV